MPTVRVLAAIAALGIAGCGGDDKKDAPKPADPAKLAAAATAAKGSARSSVEIVPNHLGMPAGLKLAGNGTVSLREPRADLRFDLSEVLGIAGLLTGTDLNAQVDGETVYADPPSIPGAGIPDGWLSADSPDLALALDPGAQLRKLAAAGGLEEVGREKIDGTSVRHFRTKDADVWIDAQNVVRRIRTLITLPEGNGAVPGTLDVTTDLDEFGHPLDAETPQDATDITKTVQEILRSPDTVLGRSGQKGG